MSRKHIPVAPWRSVNRLSESFYHKVTQASTVKDLPRRMLSFTHMLLLLPLALCLHFYTASMVSSGAAAWLLSCLQSRRLAGLLNLRLVCSKSSGSWLHETGHTLWQHVCGGAEASKAWQGSAGENFGLPACLFGAWLTLLVVLISFRRLGGNYQYVLSHTALIFIFYCFFFF